jgi:hypothetical protein
MAAKDKFVRGVLSESKDSWGCSMNIIVLFVQKGGVWKTLIVNKIKIKTSMSNMFFDEFMAVARLLGASDQYTCTGCKRHDGCFITLIVCSQCYTQICLRCRAYTWNDFICNRCYLEEEKNSQ